MKKIGIILEASPEGGGTYQYSLYVLEALAALPSNEYSVTAVVLNPFWVEKLEKLNISYQVACVPTWCRYLYKVWRSLGFSVEKWRHFNRDFHPVAQAMHASACDVWVCPAQDTWGYQVSVPTLVAIHDLMHRYETDFPEISEPAQYKAREFHYRHICQYAKGVLVDSDVGVAHVVDCYGYPESRLHVLPFTAAQYLHDTRHDAEGALKYANLPTKFFFYAAQFWEHKNHKNLVRAVALLKERCPDMQIVLAGSQKNGYTSTKALVDALGVNAQVHFLGYVPDAYMRTLYLKSYAFVMPSFCGPTNTPITESITLGRPVAVSNAYAMPAQAGTAGMTFAPDSPEDIARVLETLWTNEKLYQRLCIETKRMAKAWGTVQFNARVKAIIDRVLA